MLLTLLKRLTGALYRQMQTGRSRILLSTKPVACGQVLGTLAALVRTKRELVAENALLRQQLICAPSARQAPQVDPD